MAALQSQAQAQYQRLLSSHQARSFDQAPPERLFHPVFPRA
jgi:hypothetical protein